MSKIKNIIGDVEVNRDLLLLLTVGGLYSLSIALSNTFVNVYLWKQSGRFIDLAIYNLSIVVMQPLTFMIAGRLAKKIDRVFILRFGVSFLAIFYLTVLLVGENAGSQLVLLGSVLGVGYGFYWLAFNVLTFEITEPETRDFFNGFLGVLTSGAGMIGPIVAGYVISRLTDNTGYTLIFSFSLGLFTIAVITSFFLKRREARGQYILKKIWKERHSDENWKNVTNAHFFQGLREGIFVFLINVFVFITTKSELALGKFGLVNSAVSFFAYYFATRFIKKGARKKAILLGGLVLFGSLFLILFHMTYVTLLFYAVAIAIGYPMLLVPYSSLTYDVIGKARYARKARIEYIVVREVYLNSGRIVSILVFLLLVLLFKEDLGIPISLVLLGAGHTLIYYFIKDVSLTEPAQETVGQDTRKQTAEPNYLEGKR
ncbi:MFS transporter [Bacillus changyiensis]|uniref:MFS transporter n=1 Tax=Bacillus changyiensis TaxID=3004103 RepID=UPI0022E54128|nr:MFS transporter [Bacillus changyiensis]MDA1474829.1 MFS transporter [Bacillus changyiensis]